MLICASFGHSERARVLETTQPAGSSAILHLLAASQLECVYYGSFECRDSV
jgi:hypothetical protein